MQDESHDRRDMTMVGSTAPEVKPDTVRWLIPNAFTVLRIVLTVALVNAILRRPIIWIGEIAMLFALILLTDIVDGRIARHSRTTSQFGSVLDILADVFYVLASTGALVLREILPLIVLLCMVFEFAVFFITARIFHQRSETDHDYPLSIERFGKAVALFYFALPPLALFGAWGIFADWPISVLTVLCIVLTVLAVARRVWLVWTPRDHSTL